MVFFGQSPGSATWLAHLAVVGDVEAPARCCDGVLHTLQVDEVLVVRIFDRHDGVRGSDRYPTPHAQNVGTRLVISLHIIALGRAVLVPMHLTAVGCAESPAQR